MHLLRRPSLGLLMGSMVVAAFLCGSTLDAFQLYLPIIGKNIRVSRSCS